MIVAFLGIHIPLFGVIGALVLSSGSTVSKGGIFLLTLGLTLLATTVTLFILNALISPLTKTQQSLTNYLKTKTLPELPQHMTDEMGLLMRDVSTVIDTMHTGQEEGDNMIKSFTHQMKQSAAGTLSIIEAAKQEADPALITRHLNSIQDNINQQLKLMDEIAVKINSFVNR